MLTYRGWTAQNACPRRTGWHIARPARLLAVALYPGAAEPASLANRQGVVGYTDKSELLASGVGTKKQGDLSSSQRPILAGSGMTRNLNTPKLCPLPRPPPPPPAGHAAHSQDGQATP